MRYIAIEEFCHHHGVEVNLIREFADFGLFALHVQDNQEFVPGAAINRLERMLRLFQELEVNKEGIEVILHMRRRLKKLRQKHAQLQYRLQQLEQAKPSVSGPSRSHFIIDDVDFE
jgi:hypothetical protein